MAIFQGIIFLVFGLGLLVMDYQSLTRGWLPFGPRGMSGRLELRKDEQPLLYWAAFLGYGAAGIALTAYALLLMAGDVAPLPLS